VQGKVLVCAWAHMSPELRAKPLAVQPPMCVCISMTCIGVYLLYLQWWARVLLCWSPAVTQSSPMLTLIMNSINSYVIVTRRRLGEWRSLENWVRVICLLFFNVFIFLFYYKKALHNKMTVPHGLKCISSSCDSTKSQQRALLPSLCNIFKKSN
jgi:hypothetical protein